MKFAEKRLSELKKINFILCFNIKTNAKKQLTLQMF